MCWDVSRRIPHSRSPDEAYFPFLSHIVCSLQAVVNTALDATWSGVRPHLRHGSLGNSAIEKKGLSTRPWVDEAREKRAGPLSGDSGNLFSFIFWQDTIVGNDRKGPPQAFHVETLIEPVRGDKIRWRRSSRILPRDYDWHTADFFHPSSRGLGHSRRLRWYMISSQHFTRHTKKMWRINIHVYMYRIHLIIVHENYENDEAETVLKSRHKLIVLSGARRWKIHDSSMRKRGLRKGLDRWWDDTNCVIR